MGPTDAEAPPLLWVRTPETRVPLTDAAWAGARVLVRSKVEADEGNPFRACWLVAPNDPLLAEAGEHLPNGIPLWRGFPAATLDQLTAILRDPGIGRDQVVDVFTVVGVMRARPSLLTAVPEVGAR